MREKKVRGMKRKTNEMVTRIEENTQEFPADIEQGYWHLLRRRKIVYRRAIIKTGPASFSQSLLAFSALSIKKL